MVNDFDKRGMFSNRWLDFSLRQNVYDGRCYRMAETPPQPKQDVYVNVQRIQKREYIENVTFEEYPDKDSDLLVLFRWLVTKNEAQYSIETNACIVQTNPNTSNGSVNLCQVSHAKYESVVVTLYRIDDDVTTNQFDWSSPPIGTKTTQIGDYRKDFTLKEDDTGEKLINNGGERVILRSDLKFNNADSSTIWTDISFSPNFNGPEKINGKLQTNTYYYLHIEKSSNYTAQVSSPAGKTEIGLLQSFTVIQHGPSGQNGTRPVKTTSIIASNDQGFNFYNFNDKADGNDYFAWFKTPATFERRKKTTPSLRWGFYNQIGVQTSTSVPLAIDGQVTGVKSNDPTLFDVDLKATFFYETLDFDNQNNLRIPNDVPTYFGLSAKNLSVPGSDFTEVYSEYVGGRQYADYVHKLPSGLGGVDNGRYIDISYSFQAPANTQWLYRIWVTKESGDTWFANLTTGTYFPYRSSLNPSDLKITTGEFKVENWVNPSSKSNGFWYQMLRCWKNDTSNTRLSPFMTVLRKASSPTIGVNTKVDKDYPVFYYLNYKFEEDKSYQFRTILENFYTYRSSANLFRTSADSADLHIITPWGEKLKMDPPFINLEAIPTGMKRVNMYLSTNLNAYSLSNNPNIADPNGSVPIKPIQLISSKSNPQNPITYTAQPYFGGDVLLSDPNNASLVSGLNWVGVLRFDWFIQGGATFNIMNQSTNGKVETKNTEKIPYFVNGEPFGGRGWHYLGNQKKLIWFDKIGNMSNLSGLMTELNSNFPVGGDPGDYFANKTSDIKYLRNNFAATYIPYQSFNVSFDYVNESPFGISMYLGGDLPFAKEADQFWKTDIDELIAQGLVKLVGKLGLSKGSPQKCKFVGLVGNQYLFFVADNVIKFGSEENVSIDLFVEVGTNTNKYLFQSTSSGFPLNTDSNTKGYATYSVISIENFTFAGAYNDGNNRVYLTDTNLSASLVNATYSIDLGTGNNVFPNSANTTITTRSKAGNGSFAGGTWENGVWNSGWREDITVAEFNTVEQSFFYNRARIWRMSIGGRPSSVARFSAGDVVSISNVVAIDINDNRKLLNKSYTVLSIDETTMTVETETNFPIKRIEKDSEEHRILVSKNLWLSGVFLNGYFNGIWNNGLFSGYPFITKMDQSHWIDGIFNGGQFVADKIKSRFSTSKTYLLDGTPRLALNFTSPHGMETNDTISITYSNNFFKVESLGTTTILATPDPLTLVTGIAYDNKYKNVKNGTVNNTTSTGLIQNFDFYSNNASKVTSLDTMRSSRVFTYNSWIDVNYSNKSAVNIGRPQTFIETLTERSYSENNLYGYPTNDVLSSNSVFRDSFAVTSKRYRLGRKYNIINDFVGASSTFEQAFGPTDTVDGLESFKNQGWDVSKFEASKYSMQATIAYWEYNNGVDDFLLVLEFNYNVTIDNLKVGDDITIVGFKAFLTNIWQYNMVSEQAIIISKTTTGGKIKLVTDNAGSTLPYRWVFSLPFYIEFDSVNDIVINRTSDPVTTNTPLIGKEMKSIVKGKGGVVNLIPVDDINGRTNGKNSETLGKLRYTMVEFEVVDFKTSGTTKFYDDSDIKSAPPLHFNNLNYVTRLARNGNGQKVLRKIEASYLPIYRNVNHVSTPGKKKQEFFFNKRNLLMNMSGSGLGGIFNNEIYLDNLKFYEVDMIPFFQYFKSPIGRSGNINISVQIPNTGISPTIQPTEDFVDATAGNDVVNEFVEKFVASNVQVPKNVNWRADYAIYRTQQQDLTGNPGLYGEN